MPHNYWVSPISNRLLQKAGDTLKKYLTLEEETNSQYQSSRVLIPTSHQMDGISGLGYIMMYTFEIYKTFFLFHPFE